MEINLPAYNWQPREYQKPIWNYWLEHQNDPMRFIAIAHRRFGKDELCLHWIARQAMRRKASYWYMLPKNVTVDEVCYGINDKTGRRRIDDAFIGSYEPTKGRYGLIARETLDDHRIYLVNGSVIHFFGSDNYRSGIGAGVAGCVFSEWAYCDEAAFDFIRMILAENKGWAIFITTPNGQNHAATMFDNARHNPDFNDWGWHFAPADQTTAFSPETLAKEKAQLIAQKGEDMGLSIYNSEYMCSFTAALVGSYYGKEMEALEMGNTNAEPPQPAQITDVAYDPKFPVHTAWDLGVRDATAVICYQLIGLRIHIIDYIEHSGVGADWYARELKLKPYVYQQHVVPADANVEEWGNNARSRVHTLRSLGINPRVLPTQKSVHDGINAVRQILPSCWIDRTRCKRLIEALKQYHRTWDDQRKVYSDKPYHDSSSHAADAMRYLAVSGVRNTVKRDLPAPRLAIV